MSLSSPLGLLAEITHRCPLQCPYCSNPLDLIARSLTWSDEGKPATAEDTFTLTEASANGDRLVFSGEAMDDNKPSRVRYTITTAAGVWRILKETTSDGPTFSFRHEYRFTHAVGAP